MGKILDRLLMAACGLFTDGRSSTRSGRSVVRKQTFLCSAAGAPSWRLPVEAMNRRVRLTPLLRPSCETKIELPSTKSIPAFVRPQNHFKDLRQSKVRGLHVRNPPTGKCDLNFDTSRATD